MNFIKYTFNRSLYTYNKLPYYSFSPLNKSLTHQEKYFNLILFCSTFGAALGFSSSFIRITYQTITSSDNNKLPDFLFSLSCVPTMGGIIGGTIGATIGAFPPISLVYGTLLLKSHLKSK